MEKIIVTRYKSLVEYLIERGLANKETKHITYADPEDVKDKHVLGVLPYWLACKAAKLTEIRLKVPKERRGRELTLEEVKEFAVTESKTYQIIEVPFEEE